jgi:ferritin
MMNPKVEKLMKEQVNKELYSAYLYQAIAAHFAGMNLSGMAHWMNAQVQEEVIHAFKFYNHVLERGGRVVLEWESPLAAFEAALEHERFISDSIYRIYDAVVETRDHASRPLLDWFVDEQIEEEDTATDNVEKLKLVRGNGQGLLMLDREMSNRVLPAPVLLGVVPEAE